MAEAVAALVADTATRREMGRRAAEHAAGFDWESSGDRMLCEYALAAPGVAASAGQCSVNHTARLQSRRQRC